MEKPSKLNAHQGERLCPFIEQMIRDSPPLSAEAEHRLFETMPREFSEQQIVLHCLGYALKAARTFFIPHANFEDVFQYAALAIVKAAERFDPGKGIPFIAMAKLAADSALTKLYDPKYGLKDTRMNCLTDSVSSLVSTNKKGDEISYDTALSHMMSNGRDIAGLCQQREVNDGYIECSIDKILDEVRVNADSLFNGKPKNLERDIGWFKRVSRGEVIHDFADAEGFTVAQIAFSVNNIRYAIVRMALMSISEEKWGWLFAKSKTVGIARQSSLPAASRAAWQLISQTRDQSDAKRAAHRAFREKWGKSQDVMNYDRFLGCVYQRRYRLRNVYRPERGGTHTAEGYRACLLIEHEQQLGAHMSNHEPPTERNKTWQHREHR